MIRREEEKVLEKTSLFVCLAVAVVVVGGGVVGVKRKRQIKAF